MRFCGRRGLDNRVLFVKVNGHTFRRMQLCHFYCRLPFQEHSAVQLLRKEGGGGGGDKQEMFSPRRNSYLKE